MLDSIQVIITMAGHGKRFRDAGYDCPKYEIVVHGKPLFDWALLSLKNFIDAGCSFYFIARKQDDCKIFLEKAIQRLRIKAYYLVLLEASTDGQATTVLKAQNAGLNLDAPIIIYNIDTYVNPDSLSIQSICADGWVPCFQAQGEGWSFARVDQDQRILELQEKKCISKYATIGLYYFKNIKLYAQAYYKYYNDNAGLLVPQERYIAPLYNALIAQGYSIYMHEVPTNAVIPLGTPAELNVFKNASKSLAVIS